MIAPLSRRGSLEHVQLPGLRLAALIALLPLAFALIACHRSDPEADAPWLSTPELALAQVLARPVFYNAPARPWLLTKRPELLEEDDRANDSQRTLGYVQAVQNPKQFRQLDRQQRFATVLVVGDPSQYRPILDHLLDTRDWKLAYLDHTALVFRREVAAAWQPKQLDELRARLAGASAKTRSRALAQLGTKLVAVRELPAAKSIIEEAEKADAGEAEVWSAQSNYRLALGDWKAAIASAEKALALEPESPSALGCMAQALYASKRFEEAFAVSARLLAKLPDEPGVLFYHARIAHEAKRGEDEVAALKKLIALAEKAQRPVSGYRIYLAQAYAGANERDRSIEEFDAALRDPDLPEEQRKYANESVMKLRAAAARKRLGQ
jgi:Tfp pilus assembly protein PilF